MELRGRIFAQTLAGNTRTNKKGGIDMGWIFGGFLMVVVVETLIRLLKDYEPTEQKPSRRKVRR